MFLDKENKDLIPEEEAEVSEEDSEELKAGIASGLEDISHARCKSSPA